MLYVSDGTTQQDTWGQGPCWLWCGRTDTWVTWIGPVKSEGLEAPMFACADCLERLHKRVWETILQQH